MGKIGERKIDPIDEILLDCGTKHLDWQVGKKCYYLFMSQKPYGNGTIPVVLQKEDDSVTFRTKQEADEYLVSRKLDPTKFLLEHRIA